NIGGGSFNWTAALDAGGADWLRTDGPAAGTMDTPLRLAFDPNMSATARSATVAVNAGLVPGSPQAVPVVQGRRFDLNADDAVDAVDVQRLVNAILAIAVGLGHDVNGDGPVDAADLQLIVNAVLGA